MIVNQKIIATGTSGVTSYGTPSSFINDLENYLKVRSVFPEGLSMISVGLNAPSQAYQNVPWLEIDANNNPTALKYFNGARWVNIAPSNAITSSNTNMKQVFGQSSITIEKNSADKTMTSPAINFGNLFSSSVTPLVMITPVLSDLQVQLDTNANLKFNYYVTDVTRTDFKINYSYSAPKLVTDVAIPATGNVEYDDLDTLEANPLLTTDHTFKFNFTALGQI